MFEILKAGGWMMVPLLGCSILALAIILERSWALRWGRILPTGLVPEIWDLYRSRQLDAARIRHIGLSSPFGRIMAAGLERLDEGREAMRESVEQAGRQAVHELERYLNTLGTIAAVSPYLGLLGSVLGMIQVFSSFSAAEGLAHPVRLAGGIAEILIATAAGLAVAIPSLIFHRYFEGRVQALALRLEQEAGQLLDALEASRRAATRGGRVT